MRCLRSFVLAAAGLALFAGCRPNSPSGASDPLRLPIDQLTSEAKWEGKRLLVSGGRVERVYPDLVKVTDPGKKPDRVDLLCYFPESARAPLEKAVRGQGVTVIGRVVGPFEMWSFPTLKLEDCEFILGEPPAGKAVLASKGRGQVDAERDLEAGKRVLRFRHGRRGDSPPWFPEYKRLLKEQCGVETDVKPEAGPIVGLHPDDREYNEVMTAAIEKHHGAGVVTRLRKQAEGKQKK